MSLKAPKPTQTTPQVTSAAERGTVRPPASALQAPTSVSAVPSVPEALAIAPPSAALLTEFGEAPPLGFAPELGDRFAIAEYVNGISTEGIDEELIEEMCRGSKAVLKRLPIEAINEGDPDHNLPNKKKETHFSKMDPSTMPPLLVDESGEVLDGNHRLRAGKRMGLELVWCYQLEDAN